MVVSSNHSWYIPICNVEVLSYNLLIERMYAESRMAG